MSSDESLITDLSAQVGEVQAAVRSLGGDLSELGGQLATDRENTEVELHRLDAAVRTLSGVVEQVAAEQGQAADEDPATPVPWHTLDRAAAIDAWERLQAWLGDVLCPVYELTREDLPDCWTRHPAMRNELSWLHTCWSQAYLPSAAGTAAAEWHLRHLPGCLGRIAMHAERGKCGNGSCRGVAIRDELENLAAFAALTSPAVWCADGVADDLAKRPAGEQRSHQGDHA